MNTTGIITFFLRSFVRRLIISTPDTSLCSKSDQRSICSFFTLSRNVSLYSISMAVILTSVKSPTTLYISSATSGLLSSVVLIQNFLSPDQTAITSASAAITNTDGVILYDFANSTKAFHCLSFKNTFF